MVNGDYFTGLGWQSGTYPLSANAPYATWASSIPNGAFNDGEIYFVYTSAKDLATNQESFGLKASFVYDLTRPTGTITYPYNNGYVSTTGKIAGTAYDTPNGITDKVYVRIKQLTGPYANRYYRVSDSSWTVQSSPEVWNEIPLYGTLSPQATWWQLNASPWLTGETYEMDMNLKDKAGHYILKYSTVTNIKADFTAPFSTVTYPAHLDLIQTELPVISGSALDLAPGELDKVQVSYKCVTGICIGHFWDISLGWVSHDELFYDATILTGNRWQATGASTPTWAVDVDGIDFEIFAKALDKAGNGVSKPTDPGADSSYIKFTLKTPRPVSGIVAPNINTPHFRASPAPLISGTALYATGVQVRITDFGADFIEGAGAGADADLAWNGTAWESTTTFTGYVPVTMYNSPNWQWQITTGQWTRPTGKYRVISKALGSPEEAPGGGNVFIVDGSLPAADITSPAQDFIITLGTVVANVSDNTPGVVQSAYFRIKRQGFSEYWNWSASTFTALGDGSYTNLPAEIIGGIARYTTDYFSAGQAWETNKGYEALLFVFDKAGNELQVPAREFTIDRSSPTSVILVPNDPDPKGIRQIPSISGTAFDNLENNEVQIAIQKWVGTTLVWYDGAAFSKLQTAPWWLPINAGNGSISGDAKTWSYVSDDGNLDADFEPGYKYLILVRSSDTAGNMQDQFAYTAPASSMVIHIDKNPPVSVITRPLDSVYGVSGRYKRTAIGQFPTNHIRGTATDGPAGLAAGLKTSQIRLSYLLANVTYYWDGDSFETAADPNTAWLGASISGSASPWSWDYTGNITWPAGVDREYKLQVRGEDYARVANDTGNGNWETAYTTMTFIVDDIPPAVVITSPTELSLDAVTNLYGTVNADLAGFNSVEIRISTGAGASTMYWSGSAWVSAPDTWISTAPLGATSWQFRIDHSILTENLSYTFEAKALDHAGNYSTLYSTRTFVNLRPVTVVLAPSADAYNTFTRISGTAGDAAGITEVRFSIFNTDQTRCYDPSVVGAWNSGAGCLSDDDAPWIVPRSTISLTSATWAYDIQDSSWTNTAHYRVRARSKDATGNWDMVFSTASFQYDISNPVSTVTYPVDGSHINLSANPMTITGTSSDEGSGVTQINLYLRKFNGYYWNGIGWQFGEYPHPATNVAPWTKLIEQAAAFIDGERYTIETAAGDQATNPEGYGVKSTFVYDITRPTSTISYPYDGAFISQTGKINGGAYDAPNGITRNILVRIKQLTGPKADHYYKTASSSWTLAGAPNVWNQISSTAALDGVLSPSATWWQLTPAAAPWQTGATYEINAYAGDRAGNYQLVYSTSTNVKADFTAPASTVTYPAHGTTIEAELTKIEGSASDYAPGVLDKVRVSYQCVDAVECGAYLNKYWNRATGFFNSTDELFLDAQLLSGSRWEATGASSPTWHVTANGVDYKIFAKGVDQAGNEVQKPGSAVAGTSYIQFKLKPPPAVSGISTPDSSVPHWQPVSLPALVGTALYSTTVQVRVVDYGPDLVENAGNDDRAWNGSVWVPTNSFTGYTGVNTFNPPNWQWTIPSAKWNVNRKYRIISRGWNEALGGQGYESGPDTNRNREFVADSTMPVATVYLPDRNYAVSLSTIAGTVSDTDPGSVQSGYFRVKRLPEVDYWNWKLSTFTAISGTDNNLTATILSGLAEYSTAYFRNGAAWEADTVYVVQLYVTDKAGNTPSPAEKTFTVDRSSPSARFVLPVDANRSGISYLPSVSGTALDNWNDSNAEVYLAMQKLNPPQKWYNSTDNDFQTGGGEPVWLSMRDLGILSTNATFWSFTPSGLDTKFTATQFEPNEYLLLVKARDAAGNEQNGFTTTFSSAIITIDKWPPSSSITRPADDAAAGSGRYNSANIGVTGSRFYGSSSDLYYAVNNSTVAKVDIRLSYLSVPDTWYWQAPGFSSGTVALANSWKATSVNANLPNYDWSYDNDIAWPPGVDREYKLESRAMDDSRNWDNTFPGNYEDPQSRDVNVKYFIIDNTPPSVRITTPTALAVKALTIIEGTANADIAGFDKAEIRISTGNGARYWNGFAWTAVSDGASWRPAPRLGASTTYWSYPVDQGMLKDDIEYRVEARAKDHAGNFSTLYSTYTVTYDTTGPTVSLTFPADGFTYSRVRVSTPVTGTSGSTQGSANTGVSTVSVAISDVVGETNIYSACFNGVSTVTCTMPIWLPAQAPLTPWSFTSANLSFTSDHKYKVEARAMDTAGNLSVVSSVVTKYDLDRPTSTVLSPAAGYTNVLTQITGEANDEKPGARDYEAKLGTYTVKVAIKRTDSDWWNEADKGFTSGQPMWYEVKVDTSPYPEISTVSWSYSLSADLRAKITSSGRKDYWIVPYAYDLALNGEFGATANPGTSDIPAGVGMTINYDNETPVSVATSPANITSFINARFTDLIRGTASDLGAVDRVHVLIKAKTADPGLVWRPLTSDWVEMSAGFAPHWSTATYAGGNWSIPQPNFSLIDNYRIYVWVRAVDKAGNWGATPTDAEIRNNLNAGGGSAAYYFTYDNSVPQTGVTVPDKYALASSTGVIRGTAYDGSPEPSGVNEVQLKLKRSDGAYWHFANNDHWDAVSTQWYLASGISPWYRDINSASQEDGYQYYLYHTANDQAQNNPSTGASFSTFTFIVDMTTPTSRITFPADGSFLGVGAESEIRGTADDSYAGVSPRDFESGISTAATNAVEVAIRKRAGCGAQQCWWNGSAWEDRATVAWSSAVFTGASSGTWKYTLPPGTIANGTTYYALSRVRDIVANIQTVYTTNYFTGDTTPPASGASGPSSPPDVESVNSISGTAQDAPPGELRTAGVVLISIKQTTEGGTSVSKCYNDLTNGFELCPLPAYPNNRIWFSTGTTADPTGQPAVWTWDTSGINWNNESNYNVIALATDKAGNTKAKGVAEPTADIYFYVKTPAANTTITLPAGPDNRNYQISGIANISGSGTKLRATNSVQVRLKRLIGGSTGYWYDPSQHWVAADTFTWVDREPGECAQCAWLQNLNAAAAFTINNASYTITSLGFNPVNEQEPLLDIDNTRTIIIDTTTPTGFIAAPTGLYIRSIPTISGTATDPGSVSETSSFQKLPAPGGNVYVRIKRDGDYYWSGSSFSATVTNIETEYNAEATVLWSTATAVNAALVDGRKYTVYLLPKDTAGNIETDPDKMIKTADMIFDTTTPKGYLGSPPNRQVFKALSSISGTALDPPGSNNPYSFSGLERVEAELCYPAGVSCWTGSMFESSASSFNVVSGTGTWNYTPAGLSDALAANDDAYYVLRVRAVDRAGNTQNGFTDIVSSRTFIFDKTPPTSTIILPINTGKYKPAGLTGASALNGSAVDKPLPFTPDQLNKVQVNLSYLYGGSTHYWYTGIFRNDVSSDTAWLPATGTAPWNYSFTGVGGTLGFGNWISDRNYTLMVRAFDKAEPMDGNGGNMQNPVTIHNFVVDGTPPVSRISTPTADSFIQASMPQISGTSYGGVSGLHNSTSGLKIAISYVAGTDTWYWTGHASLGWSSSTIAEVVYLPVNFSAVASTITWVYPPDAGHDLPTIPVDNKGYTLGIVGLDQAGNQEIMSASSITVTSDFVHPLITISTPMAGTSAFYNDARPMISMTGNATDSPAGIVPPVRAEISRLTPNRTPEAWWNGLVWSSTASSWLSVNFPSPPAWDISSPSLVGTNKRYKVEMWAMDNAANQVHAGDYYRDFIYDVNKPSCSIITPALAYHNRVQISSLTGTAVDWVNLGSESYSGLAPAGVRIQIVNDTDGNKTYNGVTGLFPDTVDRWMPLNTTDYGLVDPEILLKLSSAAAWAYPPVGQIWPPTLVDGSSYTVRVRASDRSGNTGNYIYSERQFVYDNSAPTTTVTMPGVLYYTALPSIEGSITETISGINPVDGVQVAVRFNTTYWNGSGWDPSFTAANWKDATFIYPSSWTYVNEALANYFNTLPQSAAFTVYVRGKDVVGNKNMADTPAPTTGVAFTMDRFLPVSRSTYPAAGGGAVVYLSSAISNISGTATDADAGTESDLNNVFVRVRRYDSLGTPCYYDSTWFHWDTAPTGDWLAKDAGTMASWGKAMFLTDFKGPNGGDCYGGADTGNGFRFEIQSYARDNTQPPYGPNTEVAYATAAFIMDFSTPTVSISSPVHNAFYNSLSSLLGTAADPYPFVNAIPSTLASIWVELYDSDLKRYWNWNPTTPAWSATYSSAAITAASNWSVLAASLPVNTVGSATSWWNTTRSSATFVLKVKAYDRAGNYSNFSLNQSTFTFDRVNPASWITTPAIEGDPYFSILSLAGPATDYTKGVVATADISTVQVRIQQDGAGQPADCNTANNGYYWNGSGWQAAPVVWLGVTSYDPGADMWTFDSSGVDWKAQCFYTVKSSATDNAGNAQPEAGFGTRRFQFFPLPSIIGITSPGNGRYQKAIETFSGVANTTSTQRVDLAIKRNSDNWYWNFITPDWQPGAVSTGIPTALAPTWAYSQNLPAFLNNSSYTFTAWGYNPFGIVAATVTNTVYFDTTAPNISILVPDAAQLYYNSLPKLSGTASDPPGATPPAAGIGSLWVELKAENGPYFDAGKPYWNNFTSTFTAGWNRYASTATYYLAGSSWAYTVRIPTAAFINDVKYKLMAKATDITYNDELWVGNESDYSAPVYFNFDIVTPTATLDSVAAAQKRSGVDMATGTIQEQLVLANQTGGGYPGMQIQFIKVHIKNNLALPNPTYWTGSTWNETVTNSTTAVIYQSSWSTTAMPVWDDQGKYTMWSEAVDKAGNTQTNFNANNSSATFTIDNTAPIVVVNAPAANAKIAALTQLTGTASDPNPATNSGISSTNTIQAQISYLSGGDTYYYDNATGFSSYTLTEITAWWPATTWTAGSASSGTWTYVPAGLPAAMTAAGDKVYRARARTQDNAVPSPNPVNKMTNAATNANIIYDVTKPVSRIMTPRDEARVNTLTSINGTAVDNLAGISAVGQIKISIQEVSPGNGAWDGVAPGSFTLTGETFQPLDAVSLSADYTAGAWTFTAPKFQDGYKYIIKVKAADDVPNTETDISSVTFTYDQSAPVAVITYPKGLTDPDPPKGNMNHVTLGVTRGVSGTAFEQFVIKSASVSFQEVGGRFYDVAAGTFSSPTEKWIVTNQPVNIGGSNYTWSFTAEPLLSKLQDNYDYNIRVMANDMAGNPGAPALATRVKYDDTEPASNPVTPANGAFINNLASITGTALDPGSNPYGTSGIAATRISISSGTSFWDGSGWAGSETWLLPVTGGAWSKTTQLPPSDNVTGLKDGALYTVMTYAYDVAGNTQSVIMSGNSFRFDVSSPTAFITQPLNNYRYSSLSLITGTADDAYNVKFPQVRFFDISDPKYWMEGSGNCGLKTLPNWVKLTDCTAASTATWHVALDSSPVHVPGGFTWRYNPSAALIAAWPQLDNQLRVDVKAFDEAGNWSLVTSTFTVDNVAPSSVITYPPVNGVIYSSMTAVYGTSLDETSAVVEVSINMWYLSAGVTYYWWPGSGQRWRTVPPSWPSIDGAQRAAGASLPPWSYSPAEFYTSGSYFAWKEATHDGGNGKTFYLATKAIDATTNVQTILSTRTFVFDNVPPMSRPTTPGVDTAYTALPTGLAGTAADPPLVDTANTVTSVKLSILSENEPAGARYFGGTLFDSIPEVWVSVKPENLFPSSWTYSSFGLTWADTRHYVVKSSATDSTGNVQSDPGRSRFLFDQTEPDSSVVEPLNAIVYGQAEVPWGNSSDPGYNSADVYSSTGSGVWHDPAVPWHAGKIDVMIFRDTAPVLASNGPIAPGGYDTSGYFWNGSTWTAASAGAVWVPAVFDDEYGTWRYDGLVCTAEKLAAGTPCWAKGTLGEAYVIWSRATDNAGVEQTILEAGPKFRIAANAKSFALSIKAPDTTVMDAGYNPTLTVEAKDDVNGTGNTASAYQSTVTFYAVYPSTGPEYMDDDDAVDDYHGLPRMTKLAPGDYGIRDFVIRMRRAGARTLRVEDKDNSTIFGTIDLTVNPTNPDRVMVIADYNPDPNLLLPGQHYSPGKMEPAGMEGRTGAPRATQAGTGINFLLAVTDSFWNVILSSAVNVWVSDTDDNNAAVAIDGFVAFTGSTTIPSRIFTSADPVGWKLSATGAGVPNNANPSSNVPVTGKPVKNLLLVMPGETRAQGKFTGTLRGKNNVPGLKEQVAGSTFTVTVYAVDEYYNTDLTTNTLVSVDITTDKYEVNPATRNLTNGVTTFALVPVVAGTHTVTAQSTWLPAGSSFYFTPDPVYAVTNPVKVWWNYASKLVIVAQGDSLDPGKPPYGANPSVGGRAGTAAPLTAGVTTNMMVYLTDAYFNAVTGVTPFLLVSSNTPVVEMSFLNDPNIALRGFLPAPKSLIAGATNFRFIPVTRNQPLDPLDPGIGLSVQVVDTGGTGTHFSTDTVGGLTVNAGISAGLQIVVPPELPDEGTFLGKKNGPAGPLTAGTSYTITVRAVDAYFNKDRTDGRYVKLTSNDIYAFHPDMRPMADGEAKFNAPGFLPSAATGNLVLNAVDADTKEPKLSTDTSSGITVVPGTPSRMIIVLPTQYLVPGKVEAPFGVAGAISTQTAGAQFPIMVYASDWRGNKVGGLDRSPVRLTSDDFFAALIGDFSMTGGSVALSGVTGVALRSAGVRYLTANDASGESPGLGAVNNSGTFNLNASNPTRLRALIPGEARVPGSTANGRQGTPDPDLQVGVTFYVTVDITDYAWNLTPGTSQEIRLKADNAYTDITPSTQVIVGSATFTVYPRKAGSTIFTAERVTFPNPSPWGPPSLVSDIATTVNIHAGSPARFLMLLPDEDFSQGSPTGKTGSVNQQKAGTSFGVRVGVVDAFFNLCPGKPADVEIGMPFDPYAPAVSTAGVNTGVGYTGLIYVSMRRAATHYLTAQGYGLGSDLSPDPNSSTFTVRPADPMGLQILLPGETAVQGGGIYPNGGKVAASGVSTQTAGVAFTATVNLVDNYMNLYSDLTVGPTIYIVTSDLYDNDVSSTALNNGTGQFPLALVTRNPAATAKVFPVNLSDNYVCTGSAGNICLSGPASSSTTFKVYASTPIRLETVLPGTNLVEGKCNIAGPCRDPLITWPGRSGPPPAHTIGTGNLFASVYLTDRFFNKTSEAGGAAQDTITGTTTVMPQVLVSAPYDYKITPGAAQTLVSGSAVFSIDARTSFSTYTVLAATTAASAYSYASGVSTLTVHPGPVTHLQYILPSTTVAAGFAFTAQLYARDVYENLASTGPNVYLGTVTFIVTAQANPNQKPGLAANTAFYTRAEAGMKQLTNWFTLKRAGVDTIGAYDPLADVSVSPQAEIRVLPGSPSVYRVEPNADVPVEAGTQDKAGNQTLTAALSDAYDNSISASGVPAYISISEVYGSTGVLQYQQGTAWVDMGVSTLVYTDANGLIGSAPNQLAYKVSWLAGDWAKVWIGTAPINWATYDYYKANRQNMSGTMTTVGGAPAKLLFISSQPAALAGIEEIGGLGAEFIIERRDYFGNLTTSLQTDVSLSIPSAQEAVHTTLGRTKGILGVSGDYGFRDPASSGFLPLVSIMPGQTNVTFRYHDRVTSYSGVSPSLNTAEGGRPGYWTIEARSGSLQSASHQLRVDPLAISGVVFANPQRTLRAGLTSNSGGIDQLFYARLCDLFRNPAVATVPVQVQLSTFTRQASALGESFSFSSSPVLSGAFPPVFKSSASFITVPIDQYQTTFYYLDTTASSVYVSSVPTKPIIRVSVPTEPMWAASTQAVTVIPAETFRINVSSNSGQVLTAGVTSQAFALSIEDKFGNPTPVTTPLEDAVGAGLSFTLNSGSLGSVRFSAPGLPRRTSMCGTR